ncbi:MAG: class I SAM-dependent methyltransferase [Holophagales bacterium]|nr:class I SAM-dependent methyltransferase [Holophagales bacterium]
MLDFTFCRSHEELVGLHHSEPFRYRFMLETFLARKYRDCATFRIPGFCSIDAQPVDFEVDWEYALPGMDIDWLSPDGEKEHIPIPNWRERMVCPICRMNNRQRAMAAFVLRVLAEKRTALGRDPRVYLSEQVTPMFELVSSRLPEGTCVGSEYLGPDIPSGSVRDGLRHENLKALSFGDASMDYLISCSVLEHVDRPLEAVSEMARVLRPGGELALEIPFDYLRYGNVVRARSEGNEIHHDEEPSYHGNPLSNEGSLVFTDFGWELIDQIHATGLFACEAVVYWSFELGHLGGLQFFFRLERSDRPWGEAAEGPSNGPASDPLVGSS